MISLPVSLFSFLITLTHGLLTSSGSQLQVFKLRCLDIGHLVMIITHICTLLNQVITLCGKPACVHGKPKRSLWTPPEANHLGSQSPWKPIIWVTNLPNLVIEELDMLAAMTTLTACKQTRDIFQYPMNIIVNFYTSHCNLGFLE